MKIGNTSNYIAFNSYGGFTKSKDEYHILNTKTPLPWCNVMANENFGTIISSYGTVNEYIKKSMNIFIPKDDTIKIQQINLENIYGEEKELEITYKMEVALGVAQETNKEYIISRIKNNILELQNPYSLEFSNCTVFVMVIGNDDDNVSYSFDAENATTKIKIKIPAYSKISFSIIVGGTDKGEEYINYIYDKYSKSNAITKEFNKTKKYWRELVVRNSNIDDEYINIMYSGWLLYQTIVCRLYAKSGFYQSGGAIGFRDQLQDSLALISSKPEFTRKQIILNASKQFEKGDVLHWWHEHNGAGIRTYFSDDYLWLAYVLSEYISKTSDYSILDIRTNYLEDKHMGNKRELYDVFHSIPKDDSIYEHAKKAILYSLSRKSPKNGLLDIGDWNDGFSNIRGQSVWLTFFMMNILDRFKDIANYMKDFDMVKICQRERHILKYSIISNCWDTDHFVRAFFENGEILGAYSNNECKIDLISQAWAVISMINDLDVKYELNTCIQTANKYLVDKENMIVKLLYPPFDKPKNNPGYIKAYIPGIRENGGQYTHAATWLAKAYFELGKKDEAIEILKYINPIYHSDTKEKADRYMVEPYVVAADIYSNPEHIGRGGWTWYTGSSAWNFKIIEDYLDKK